VLAIAVAVAVFVVALTRSRLGRMLRGAADSAVALETSGLSVNVTRVLVFCISAFLAAIGGALAGAAQSTVSADAYQPILSLTYFALIIIVAGGAPWDAVLASAGLFLIPSYVTGSNVSVWLQLAFGAIAILYAVVPTRAHGMPLGLRRLIDRAAGGVRLERRKAVGAANVPPAVTVTGGIEVDGLVVRFGGLVAVSGVTLRARNGVVTGLIGPNGAGKTTTFNACSGLIRPSSGRVRIGTHDVSRHGPAMRARMGLGRTFQKMQLFESLTVRENVEAGAEAPMAGANPLTQLFTRAGQRAAVSGAAQHALELCEVADLADLHVSALSTGQRRLVELARCLAGPYGLLLLDEPSSGLDRAETEKFGAILKRVVAEREVGILLVEHDMSLVLDVCQHIYVLDFGELIFEGSPSEVVHSPIVKAAYLGDAAVEDAVEPAVGRTA
jgi:ABC-type branched-subunit amino acid transport system ATPase component